MSDTPTAPAGDSWAPVEGDVRSLTLRISVKCEHCGQPVPINGPTRRLQCPECLQNTSLRGFNGALSDARKGMKELGSPYDYRIAKDPSPECASCGARVPLGDLFHQHGATTSIPCPSCNSSVVTYPVPSWLRGQFHGALQIFGGDPPESDSGGSAALAPPAETPRPVLMSCPGCGAGLKIGADAQRTTECEYCHASVFIPDALWKSLHPAATQKFWTITYAAKKKKKKKHEPRPKPAPEPAPAPTPAPAPAAKQKRWLPLVLALLAAGALAIYLTAR